MDANHSGEHIGNLVKQRRQKLHIRQADVAELAGVSLRTLIAIEQGKANPSIDTLTKVANVLGLELTLTIR